MICPQPSHPPAWRRRKISYDLWQLQICQGAGDLVAGPTAAAGSAGLDRWLKFIQKNGDLKVNKYKTNVI